MGEAMFSGDRGRVCRPDVIGAADSESSAAAFLAESVAAGEFDSGEITSGQLSMLVGFGVGWSWAGCEWRETYHPTH